ncbi:MAG: sigma-70 family RNA polymerase sigma factor [Planctomycetota bacterium]
MSDSGSFDDDGTQPPTEGIEVQWRELIEEVRPGLRSFLTAKLPQAADVEDCLQTVILAALESRPQIPESARRAWLFRVASNEAALYWRKKKTTDRVLEKHGQYHVTADERTAANTFETKETADRIQRAISELSPDVQRIVRMRIQENLTFQQIADQLGTPLGTVLTRMRRAMERLRNQFKDQA